ncbi:MAG: hypothetical protein QM638_18045 [Nocardioides sp.]|uniref:hypothetical protein n=1 Tax=Nocardioides sp. TaxID=35761 RepID=UPI0039E6B8E7
MRSSVSRGLALVAAGGMLALAAAPADAATHVAQASATAVSLSLASASTGTGSFTAVNDGTGQSTTGSNEPAVTLLSGQKLITAGVLAQDAVTHVRHGRGSSAACAGLAGDGASVLAVGDGNCLSGGENLALDIGNLDFSSLDVVASPLFDGLDTQLKAALKPYQDQLTSALSAGLKQFVDALGDPALHLDLGAVQSHCTASGDTASGDSEIVNAAGYVEIPTIGRVDLFDLPVDPAPNTKVVTDLSSVAGDLEDALRTQLTAALKSRLTDDDSPLAALATLLDPAGDGIDTVLDQLDPVLNKALAELSDQLAPVEDNLLDITLNKQTRGTGQITVTALDVSVGSAAKAFTGSDLAHLSIGTSHCGPSGRITTTRTTTTTKHHHSPATASHPVPTVVTAGLADAPPDRGSAGRTGLVGLLVLGALGAGAVAYRRTVARAVSRSRH